LANTCVFPAVEPGIFGNPTRAAGRLSFQATLPAKGASWSVSHCSADSRIAAFDKRNLALRRFACNSNRTLFHRVIALSPGVDPAQQRPNAQDAFAMKQ
jgi:hypothetical protein